MHTTPPPVDDREFNDIVAQCKNLAAVYCPEWTAVHDPESHDNDDPGAAMIYLFARLMEIVITRLNRLPGKIFLAFLDYIGAALGPPEPARALLQFFLSKGAVENIHVPAGTQASVPGKTDADRRVFETMEHLEVTPVQLTAAFTCDPGLGRYSDVTAVVTGEQPGEFQVFEPTGSQPPQGPLAFTLPGDKPEPAFYLGFDAAPRGSFPFYLPLVDQSHVQGDPGPNHFFIDGHSFSPWLRWEYSSPGGWSGLTVTDETRNLDGPGHVRLIAPNDMTQIEYFGIPAYWLRVRKIEAPDYYSPRLGQVYLNTVWAENAKTIENELLGSSDGTASQTFKLRRSPVLPEPEIWVKEREIPPVPQYETITAKEGPDAVQVTREGDGAGDVAEIRVRWHEVNHFYSSGPLDRHYTVDHLSGEIRFGDGINGMNPPPGTDNIICSRYRTGGGAAGNAGAGEITELHTSLPFIAGVTNPEPADGGADAETLAEIAQRGPQLLKHRDRAVTIEDYEYLLLEAPGSIARGKCIPSAGLASNRQVKIIIVPDVDEPRPYPSPNLVRIVRDFFSRHCFTALANGTRPRFHVTGPGYISVSATARIVPQHPEKAALIHSRVLDTLETFFHPLRGGPNGSGWEFGRDVHLSEVMTVLQNTEGVDYVDTLSLQASVSAYYLTFTRPVPMFFPAQSPVSRADNKIKCLLAEDVFSNAPGLTLTGFKECDRVRLTDISSLGKESADLVVLSVSPDCLTVDALDIAQDFPAGSEISTPDRRVVSYITKPLLQSNLTVTGNKKTGTITIAELNPNNEIIINHPNNEKITAPLQVAAKQINLNRIPIDQGYLVYNGAHNINFAQS